MNLLCSKLVDDNLRSKEFSHLLRHVEYITHVNKHCEHVNLRSNISAPPLTYLSSIMDLHSIRPFYYLSLHVTCNAEFRAVIYAINYYLSLLQCGPISSLTDTHLGSISTPPGTTLHTRQEKSQTHHIPLVTTSSNALHLQANPVLLLFFLAYL